jgi:hypothetical protein
VNLLAHGDPPSQARSKSGYDRRAYCLIVRIALSNRRFARIARFNDHGPQSPGLGRSCPEDVQDHGHPTAASAGDRPARATMAALLSASAAAIKSRVR